MAAVRRKGKGFQPYLSSNLYVLTEMIIDCIRPRQEFYEIQTKH